MNCDRVILFHFLRSRPASHVFFSQIHPARLLISTKVYVKRHVHRQVARQCPHLTCGIARSTRGVSFGRNFNYSEGASSIMNYPNLESRLQKHGTLSELHSKRFHRLSRLSLGTNLRGRMGQHRYFGRISRELISGLFRN